VPCESWKAKLDAYLDGELPSEEMRAFDAHARTCASCAADALARVQMKRSILAAGKRFAPSAEFRQRMQSKLATKPRRTFGLTWMLAAALSLVAIAALLSIYVGGLRSRREQAYSEIADLHVAALASSSPVDVVSTDRHTVKPWFQGKIPFAFDLPELQNSEFSLLGGRMTYLGQTPGAHLIYAVRKHQISVFVFQEGALGRKWSLNSTASKAQSFNLATWSQGGLRYFVIGDASSADISSLANLFKATDRT
jgi:anti-sigma factor RsiW